MKERKNNLILFVTFWCVSIPLFSQIGINTDNPMALFHVDGGADNSAVPTAAQIANDVVFTSAGYLGVGTLTPTTELEVVGAIAIKDGLQMNAKVLTSDADGIASWQSTQLNSVAIWNITGNLTTFNADTETLLKGTGTLKKNDITNLTISDALDLGGGVIGSSISIPPGRYIFYPACDINTLEYGKLHIREVGVTKPLISIEYSLSASGVSAVINSDTTKIIYLTFEAIDAQSTWFVKPGYTQTFVAGLIVHRIP
ncbi:hypothetical protein [Dysgonomonas alginatilytica]|nr:hypothetical protein [Dysgonomonas alginatilytica]